MMPDLFVLEFMSALSNPLLDRIMSFITKLGDKGLIWILLAFVLIFRRNTRIYGIAIIIALSFVTILGEGIIKNLVQRNRPFIEYGFDILIKPPTSYSFPSGHTASSFAVLGIFLFSIKKYRCICFILAFLIAFSRLYLGVHYFSDVLAGAIIGTGAAYLVDRLYLKKILNVG